MNNFEEWLKAAEEQTNVGSVAGYPKPLGDKKKKKIYDGRTREGRKFVERIMARRKAAESAKQEVKEAFAIDKGANVKMKIKGKEVYGKVVATLKVLGKPGVTVKWSDGTKGNFKMDQFSSVSMDRKADYQISEDAVKEATDVK